MSLLSANGQRWVELGGERCWLQRVKGDICISYQWLHVGKKEPQACMVLFPANGPKMDGGAYAIPQENAYEYADSRGRPTPHLMAAAINAATSMGFFPDQSTCFRIVDAIVEGMSDLIRMPSEQPRALDIQRQVMGIEARAKVEGQVVHEEVV
jgi:hypothetical protein